MRIVRFYEISLVKSKHYLILTGLKTTNRYKPLTAPMILTMNQQVFQYQPEFYTVKINDFLWSILQPIRVPPQPLLYQKVITVFQLYQFLTIRLLIHCLVCYPIFIQVIITWMYLAFPCIRYYHYYYFCCLVDLIQTTTSIHCLIGFYERIGGSCGRIVIVFLTLYVAFTGQARTQWMKKRS